MDGELTFGAYPKNWIEIYDERYRHKDGWLIDKYQLRLLTALDEGYF